MAQSAVFCCFTASCNHRVDARQPSAFDHGRLHVFALVRLESRLSYERVCHPVLGTASFLNEISTLYHITMDFRKYHTELGDYCDYLGNLIGLTCTALLLWQLVSVVTDQPITSLGLTRRMIEM